MRLFAPLGLAVAVTVTADAYGSDLSQRARLVYALETSVIPDCPDAAALREAVSDRLGYDPFWEWAQRTIVLQVRLDQGKYVARVVKVDQEGHSTTRDIPPDKDCHQVVAAAALAISIALDIAPAPARSIVAEPESPPPVVVASASPPEPAAAEASVPVAPPPRPHFPEFALGGGVSAFTGIAPKPGVSAFAFAELRGRTVSIAGELQVSTAVAVDQFQVGMVAGAIVPCVEFDPAFVCALGEFGSLTAWSTGSGSGGSDSAPFVVLGGRGGVEVPLSVQTFVRLQGDLLVEAYGPSFAAPQKSYQVAGLVYKAPAASLFSSMIGGALGFGVGANFP